MAETLIEKVCIPCCGGIPPLTREEAERYLSVVRNGELLDDGHLLRRTSYTHAAVMLATLLMSTLVGTIAKGALPMSLTLSSPAFADGGEIPARYTCEGDDISPPLAWSEPPAGTRSLVESGALDAERLTSYSVLETAPKGPGAGQPSGFGGPCRGPPLILLGVQRRHSRGRIRADHHPPRRSGQYPIIV